MVNPIADRAREVLVMLDMWRIPVDPFVIAKEEGIEFAPGDYGDRFYARLEYLPPVNKFVIYYRKYGLTDGRIRFSIGHELAHYYLQEHRERILDGQVHNSQSDFQSRDPEEEEADEFAAALLMPEELLRREVNRHYNKVCTLKELCRLATDRFNTSIISTVRRYCECCIEACAVVMSYQGKVRWARYSEDMGYRNMRYIKFGIPVPTGTHTARLWGITTDGFGEHVEGSCETTRWFPYTSYGGRLWEEAMLLGKTGFVLTYLTLENPDD